MTALLRLLRRWRCRVAHRDLWVYMPWAVVCPKCGEVVSPMGSEQGERP